MIHYANSIKSQKLVGRFFEDETFHGLLIVFSLADQNGFWSAKC